MKIGIVSSTSPFINGGAELLAEQLKNQLLNRGHKVILINIPFYYDDSKRIVDQILLNRLFHFDNFDKLICLKFPSYLIKHPNKVIWLLHQHRQFYDLSNTQYGYNLENLNNLAIKNVIYKIDRKSFLESKKNYSISKNVAKRLLKNNKIKSEVLYPPLENKGQYFSKSYGDFFYYPSRLNDYKRQMLAVKSMKYTKTKVKLILSGESESHGYLNNLHIFIKENKLQEKVIIIDKWITEKQKLDYFSESLGCLFIPFEEDYGYVTLESFYSKKPVITCSDSGGPLEFVINKKNGYVTDPTASAIAKAMDTLYSNKKLAQKMGENGYESLSKLNINWDYVIKKLTL